jgi:hypothetical protein
MTMDSKVRQSLARRFGYGVVFALLLGTALPGISADDRKPETIDAIARGTGTQMGKQVHVKVTISQFSTEADRQVLVDAFKKGQNQGLVKALEKMKGVGQISITGKVGYQLSYIALIPTPTGRKIRFAANRLVRFGEAYYNTQSTAFNLTAGEIDLNDSDKGKSAGVLYPAAQLIINKDGQLQFELRRNPWNLINIIDWNGAGTKE